jgi:hypothetical protein
MADKIHLNGIDTQMPPKTSWLDGLPHDFNGWGPQTPDPDDVHIAGADFVPDTELTWRGDEDRNLHVWRFDGRRHHSHH